MNQIRPYVVIHFTSRPDTGNIAIVFAYSAEDAATQILTWIRMNNPGAEQWLVNSVAPYTNVRQIYQDRVKIFCPLCSTLQTAETVTLVGKPPELVMCEECYKIECEKTAPIEATAG